MAILREHLLAGRTVATNAGGELRDGLQALGAEIAEVEGGVDALVHDARADFGDGGSDALVMALETTWETIADAANASLIPSDRGGKVVLIAPEDVAGEYADAARAAIENLARTLSTEWARYGITTTALTPRADTDERDLAVLTAFLLSKAGDYYSGARFELGAR
jgi:NAD(P)-dependent dehydrogenase (short-subunit alcohol dehydrogenase family)